MSLVKSIVSKHWRKSEKAKREAAKAAAKAAAMPKAKPLSPKMIKWYTDVNCKGYGPTL